jgi:hypothetical protein
VDAEAAAEDIVAEARQVRRRRRFRLNDLFRERRLLRPKARAHRIPERFAPEAAKNP